MYVCMYVFVCMYVRMYIHMYDDNNNQSISSIKVYIIYIEKTIK